MNSNSQQNSKTTNVIHCDKWQSDVTNNIKYIRHINMNPCYEPLCVAISFAHNWTRRERKGEDKGKPQKIFVIYILQFRYNMLARRTQQKYLFLYLYCAEIYNHKCCAKE